MACAHPHPDGASAKRSTPQWDAGGLRAPIPVFSQSAVQCSLQGENKNNGRYCSVGIAVFSQSAVFGKSNVAPNGLENWSPEEFGTAK